MEFELANFKAAVQQLRHYDLDTPEKNGSKSDKFGTEKCKTMKIC